MCLQLRPTRVQEYRKFGMVGCCTLQYIVWRMSSSKSKMLLVAFFSTLAVPQATFCGTGPEIRFEHLTVEQGLPSNSVFGISQDSRGFMWFGTGDAGLCKFDGYSYTVYKHDPLDSNSIPVNNVFQVYKDGSGTLWVNGCKTHDRATGKFTYYRDLKVRPILRMRLIHALRICMKISLADLVCDVPGPQ